MKKSPFSCAIMAVAALFMTSCSDSTFAPEPEQGDLATVSFSLDLDGNSGTKTGRKAPRLMDISDGKTANTLVYAVFDKDGNRITDIEKVTKTTTFPCTENIRLAKGQKYTVAFWAQNSATSAYTVDDNMNVAIDYAGVNNDETRDAFFKTLTFTVTGDASKNVVLKRPFAQLNLGTTTEDFNAAKTAGLELAKSTVTIKNAANAINLVTGKATGDVEVTYTLADVPAQDLTIEGNAYKYLSMCYFLVNDGTEKGDARANLTSVAFELKNADESKNLKLNSGLNNIPVQRNWRTNILSEGLLTGNIKFNISIDEKYVNDINISHPDGATLVANAKQLADAMAKGGNVRLLNDINYAETGGTPVTGEVTLDLNGHNIIATKRQTMRTNGILNVFGKLTIEGEGEIKTYDVTGTSMVGNYALEVKDGGELIIKGGKFTGTTSAIQVTKGTATIEGGEFDAYQPDPDGYNYLLNCIDAAYKAGEAKIIVKGGKFHGFNPGNNTAEGASTNFLATGFKAVEDGDWFNVVAE